MTVICLTNCPPRLRGDLTKWLMEINTGVYVGNISTRVREELWDRITENIRNGQATMVYRSAGEQHMDFRVHNTSWKPVDYDGLKLIMRPNRELAVPDENDPLADGFSKASKIRKMRRAQRAMAGKGLYDAYTVVDLETTGLNYNKDDIIEIAALRIRNGTWEEEFSCLVHSDKELTGKVQEMTGIGYVQPEEAMPLKTALEKLTAFIGTDRLLFWNASFDLAFLQISCNKCGLQIPQNKVEDALKLARRTVKELPDYRLTTVAEHFGIDAKNAHRALQDCHLTHAVYKKLIEI